MKEAYSIEQQKKITIQEAIHPDFYGVVKCPDCQEILEIRKGKRPCFAHERTEEECPSRLSWEQSNNFPRDLPSRRYQCYSLLRNRLLNILSQYYIEGKYSDRKRKITTNINFSTIANWTVRSPVTNNSRNMLLVLSNRTLEGLIWSKIRYGLANKFENRGHCQYVWDILITFLMYSKHFSSLEALEILISGNDVCPKTSLELENCLNVKPINNMFHLEATHGYKDPKSYWQGFYNSELGKYCIDVVDFVLDTFFYINWGQILKDWVAENPAVANF
jgi:hypothetical protein